MTDPVLLQWKWGHDWSSAGGYDCPSAASVKNEGMTDLAQEDMTVLVLLQWKWGHDWSSAGGYDCPSAASVKNEDVTDLALLRWNEDMTGLVLLQWKLPNTARSIALDPHSAVTGPVEFHAFLKWNYSDSKSVAV
jgi:hypothetical protein